MQSIFQLSLLRLAMNEFVNDFQLVLTVTVDESPRKEEGSEDEEKEKKGSDSICCL